jgi:hypothetical protein
MSDEHIHLTTTSTPHVFMTITAYDNVSKRFVPMETMLVVEKLMKLRETKSLWECITACIDAWKALKPKQWESYLVDVAEDKKTRANKYGSTKDKSLRYIVDIPTPVYKLIRILFPSEELKMDKKFFRAFARRYPEYRVANKI